MTILRDFHVVRIAQADIDLMDTLSHLDDQGAPGIYVEKFQLALHENPRLPTEITWRDGSKPTRGRAEVLQKLTPALHRWWREVQAAKARAELDAELEADRQSKGDGLEEPAAAE